MTSIVKIRHYVVEWSSDYHSRSQRHSFSSRLCGVCVFSPCWRGVSLRYCLFLISNRQQSVMNWRGGACPRWTIWTFTSQPKHNITNSSLHHLWSRMWQTPTWSPFPYCLWCLETAALHWLPMSTSCHLNLSTVWRVKTREDWGAEHTLKWESTGHQVCPQTTSTKTCCNDYCCAL